MEQPGLEVDEAGVDPALEDPVEPDGLSDLVPVELDRDHPAHGDEIPIVRAM